MNPSRSARALGALAALALTVAACGGDDDSSDPTDAPAGTDTVDTSDTSDTTGDTGSGGTAATSVAPAEDLGTVKVGLVCGGMTPAVAQIAMNTDAFEPAGVEVEKLCFDGGSEGVQALIGGSLDVFLGSFEHVASTRDQGLDMRGYAVINNVFPYWALTGSDSEYETIADLDGEVVGVTSPGSLSETGLRAAVDEAGISFDDLEVIGVGSGATMRAALSNDQVAAGMVSEPGISELTQSGEYRILWEPPFAYVSIVAIASEGWVGDNEDTMRAFLNVLQTTATRAADEPEWAMEAMADEGFEVDPEALQTAVERTLDGVPDGLRVTDEDVASTSELLISVGRLEEPVTIDEGFDFSYLAS